MKDRIPCIGGPLDGRIVDDVGNVMVSLESEDHAVGIRSSLFRQVEYQMQIWGDVNGKRIRIYVLRGLENPIEMLLDWYCS